MAHRKIGKILDRYHIEEEMNDQKILWKDSQYDLNSEKAKQNYNDISFHTHHTGKSIQMCKI